MSAQSARRIDTCCSGRIATEPASNAEPFAMRRQDLVRYPFTEEAYQCSGARHDIELGTAGFRGRPDAQAAAIVVLPVVVEVEHRRDDTGIIAIEGIQVALVERTRIINGKMGFEIEQAEKQLAVDVETQPLKFLKQPALGQR